MKKILIALVLAVGLSGYAYAYALMIDVRTQGEWDSGHIDGATHIPLFIIADNIHNFTDSKDEKILLYCRSGNRSGKAKKILDNLGYTNTKSIGGITQVSETYNLKIINE